VSVGALFRSSALARGACAAGAAGLMAVLAAGVARAQDDGSGRALFTANGCFQCHGYEGQGGAAGPRIAPSPYPFEAFSVLVRRPANTMPAYAPSVLPEQDLRAIYDYVRSMAEPPRLEDIPTLR
jgi:mono/diheme cytochrome c family protein